MNLLLGYQNKQASLDQKDVVITFDLAIGKPNRWFGNILASFLTLSFAFKGGFHIALKFLAVQEKDIKVQVSKIS